MFYRTRTAFRSYLNELRTKHANDKEALDELYQAFVIEEENTQYTLMDFADLLENFAIHEDGADAEFRTLTPSHLITVARMLKCTANHLYLAQMGRSAIDTQLNLLAEQGGK